MSIKSDKWIKEQSMKSVNPMISPFIEGQISRGVISYGLSSYGYDIRVSNKFKVVESVIDDDFELLTIDPKKIDKEAFVDLTTNCLVLPPNSFALAQSVERFNIPADVLAICVGKSTYARCGIIVNVTPLEPEWSGILTIEISNTTTLPAKIYANEGIAQLLFFQSDERCLTTYADKKGKYQDQIGIALPFVE